MTEKRLRIYLVAFLAIAAILVWRVALARPSELRVSFLDVGQGDAIFIQFPDTTEVLIDGGPDATVLHELSEQMSPGDHSIDMVIATHPDADHLAGLVDVLARYEVETIVETGILKDTQLSEAWNRAVKEEGANIVIIDGPKRLRFGETAALDILWPQQSFAGEMITEPNVYGIVGQLTYGASSFLFTADIDRSVEGRLLLGGALRDVDVLKVAHHGSKTSTGEALLDAVRPEIAVISVGEGNRYGHPHPSVLDRLARRGITIFRTDRDGRIEFLSNGTTMGVKPR